MSNRQVKLLFVFGTRPEAIKMAPLVHAFSVESDFEVKVAVTAQHREMLDQVLDFFDIVPDFDLNLMKPDQTLFDVTADGIRALAPVLHAADPDMIFVQGDTTTAFVGALTGYYKKCRVAHVEAGLRSHNKYAPFPEEMNRIMAGHLADLHLAPTQGAVDNLKKENIVRDVHVVGNTVIDALFRGLELLKGPKGEAVFQSLKHLPLDRRYVLVTGHRRESFGKPFEHICEAIAHSARNFPDVHFIYPVHLNPNVQEPVNRILAGIPNVHLTRPMDYPSFIALLDRSYLVLTDSGGLQEEAPSLGKPVLVMREVTERQEGIDAGTARLVGTDKQSIMDSLHELLSDEKAYERMAKSVNPYGDGKSAPRTVDIVRSYFSQQGK